MEVVSKATVCLLKETEDLALHPQTPKGTELGRHEGKPTFPTENQLSRVPQEVLQATVHVLQGIVSPPVASFIWTWDLPEFQGD